MESTGRQYSVNKTDEEWKNELSPEEFAVLRQAATERPFSHPFEDDATQCVYACRACGAELFRSDTKFDARCGWPSFYQPLAGDAVEYVRDTSLGRERVEVRCAACGGHLGHVFSGEGFDTPTDDRYCINGIALTQVSAGGTPAT